MVNNLRLYRSLVSELRQLLPDERGSRLSVLALFIVGMQASGSVHLSRIVSRWPLVAGQLPSLINRLHRFVCNVRVVAALLYAPVACALLRQGQGGVLRLVMDATKVGVRGEQGCRLLTISLCYHKRTLPVAFSVHAGAKGQIAFSAQKALLEQLLPLLPLHTQVVLIADAGFEAMELVAWLQEHDWDFVLRRNGKNRVQQTEVQGGAALAVRLDALAVRPGETHYLGHVVLSQSQPTPGCYLTVHWKSGEDTPWYLIASRPGVHWAIRTYCLRMWVEEMYGDLKRHGFNLDATHLTLPDRIERLVLAVCLTYVLCIAHGSRVVKNGLRRQIDAKSRRDKSYFRLGFDWIERCLRLDMTIKAYFLPYPSK